MRVERIEGEAIKGATFTLNATKTVVLVGRNGEGKSGRLLALPTALQKPPPRRGGRGGVHPWFGDEPADVGGTAVATLICEDQGASVEVQRRVGKKHEVSCSVGGDGKSGGDAEAAIEERFAGADGMPVDLSGFAGLTAEKQREQLEAAAGAGAAGFDHVSIVETKLNEAQAEWTDDAGAKQAKPVHVDLASDMLARARRLSAAAFIADARAWLGTGKGGLFSEWNGRLTDARGARERLPMLGTEDVPAGRPAQLEDVIHRNEEERSQTRERLAVARAQVEEWGRKERNDFAVGEEQSIAADRALATAREATEHQLRELEGARNRLAAASQALSEREAEKRQALERRDAANAAESRIRARLEEERGAAQQARESLSSTQARVEHLRKSIDNLVQHGVCPTCGVTGDILDAALAGLRSEMSNADGQLWDLENGASDAASTAAATDAELKEATSEASAARSDAARKEAEFEAANREVRAATAEERRLAPLAEEAARKEQDLSATASRLQDRLEELYRAIPTGSAPDNAELIADLQRRVELLDGTIERDKADVTKIREREALEDAYAQNNFEIDRCLHKRASVQALRAIVDEVSAKLIELTFGPVSERANLLVDAVYAGQQRFAFRPVDVGESGWGYGLREEKPRRPGKAARGWRPWKALSDSEAMICGLGLRFAELSLRDASFRPFPLDRLEAVNDEAAGRLVAFLARLQARGDVSNALFAWRGSAAEWRERVAPHLGDAASLVEVVDCDAA